MNMKVVNGKLRVTTVRDITLDDLEREKVMITQEIAQLDEEKSHQQGRLDAVNLKLQMIADAKKAGKK